MTEERKVPKDVEVLIKPKQGPSFTEKLDPEALKYFNEVCSKPFSQQAIAFLNAYWPEAKDEAEFIYSVAWETMKYADMHSKGISLVYKYEEGNDVDFDIGLYFYEQLCKFCEDPKNQHWKEKYKRSIPEMMTALRRKQELREKVDVNFDGRISFLEYLLYQYSDVANPADFCVRSMRQDEHPEITKARLALEEVNKRIRAFEEEKARLQAESQGTGVKALAAKNMLAQIESSPVKDELNKSLITAEAAVRIACKKYGGAAYGGTGAGSNQGALWWMSRDLEEKKKRYGPRAKQTQT
jgi:hypothetical protein